MTPNQRANESMEDARTKLKASSYGWMAYLFNNENEGYTFHMKFVGSDEVEMYSDFDNSTISTMGTSMYSMRNIAGPGMVFDTYNYIHILADPNSSISGGVRGEGNYTDFEFIFQQIAADTIVLKGNFRGNKLLLVKATQTEYSAFENDQYKAFRQTLQDYMIAHPFLYLSAEGATIPITLNLNLSERSAKFSYKKNEEAAVEYQTLGMAVGMNKVVFQNTFQLGEVSISEILLKDDKMYGIDIQGKEFLIRSDDNPIETLYDRLQSFSYNRWRLLKTNQISNFATIYNNAYDIMLGTGRTIEYMEVLMKDRPSTIQFNYRYTSSSGYNAYKDYRMELSNGNEVKFYDLPAGGTSGSYSNYNSFNTSITELQNFWLNTTFVLDYYTGMINGSIQTLARFTSKADPNTFVLFVIE
jgi:hypothetical protein